MPPYVVPGSGHSFAIEAGAGARERAELVQSGMHFVRHVFDRDRPLPAWNGWAGWSSVVELIAYPRNDRLPPYDRPRPNVRRVVRQAVLKQVREVVRAHRFGRGAKCA